MADTSGKTSSQQGHHAIQDCPSPGCHSRQSTILAASIKRHHQGPSIPIQTTALQNPSLPTQLLPKCGLHMECSSSFSCIGPVLRGLQEPTQAAVPLLIWLWPFLLALLQSSAPCLVCTRHKFCVPVLAHLCTALSMTVLGSLLLKRICTSGKIDR